MHLGNVGGMEQLLPPLDTSRAPLGEVAASRLVEAIVARGDVAERHYLEVRSDVDLATKLGAAKVAKFILGAANRPLELAARAFGGYAVMILGVSEGQTPGIARVEVKEIETRVRPYLSASGPGWDIERLFAGDGRDVGDLRPLETNEEGDCPVLVVVDPTMLLIRGAWTVTARGHHERYEGELTVPIAPPPDVRDGFAARLEFGRVPR